MIQLHGAATGNTLRAAVALDEAGLAYEACRIDLSRGEHRGDAYRELNATGRVPTLIDPEGPSGRPLVLTQSNAIMLYVAEKSGRLLGTGETRARALEWLLFFVTDVIAPSHAAFFLDREAGSAGASERLVARALGMYQHVEAQLEGRRFLAGDELSLADIAGFTITSSFGSSLALAALPNVARWKAEMGARPAVVKGMAAFG